MAGIVEKNGMELWPQRLALTLIERNIEKF